MQLIYFNDDIIDQSEGSANQCSLVVDNIGTIVCPSALERNALVDDNHIVFLGGVLQLAEDYQRNDDFQSSVSVEIDVEVCSDMETEQHSSSDQKYDSHDKTSHEIPHSVCVHVSLRAAAHHPPQGQRKKHLTYDYYKSLNLTNMQNYGIFDHA